VTLWSQSDLGLHTPCHRHIFIQNHYLISFIMTTMETTKAPGRMRRWLRWWKKCFGSDKHQLNCQSQPSSTPKKNDIAKKPRTQENAFGMRTWEAAPRHQGGFRGPQTPSHYNHSWSLDSSPRRSDGNQLYHHAGLTNRPRASESSKHDSFIEKWIAQTNSHTGVQEKLNGTLPSKGVCKPHAHSSGEEENMNWDEPLAQQLGPGKGLWQTRTARRRVQVRNLDSIRELEKRPGRYRNRLYTSQACPYKLETGEGLFENRQTP
jgi:hypothetical protein